MNTAVPTRPAYVSHSQPVLDTGRRSTACQYGIRLLDPVQYEQRLA